jgi:hypothetical protein
MEANQKHWPRRAALTLFGLIALGLLLKAVIAPWAIRRWLISEVHNSCRTCELSIGAVHLALLPPSLSTVNPQFTGGAPKTTVVNAKAQRVELRIRLLSLLAGQLRIGHIEIERPEVKVTEGDQGSGPSEQKNSKPLDIEIETIGVKGGSFAYSRDHHNRTGTLQVFQIDAAVGPFGSSARLQHEKAEGKATGVLEQSGKFHLAVGAYVFENDPKAEVNLEISGQNLAELNRLFGPNDGINLRGVLLEGRSSIKVRGPQLKASAYARFQDFGVKVKAHEERGGLSAFFQTLMASIKMGKQNVHGKAYVRTATASLARKPRQSLISFILNGMLQAAMKVASQGGR